jgi:hypothetical protein
LRRLKAGAMSKSRIYGVNIIFFPAYSANDPDQLQHH